MRPRERYRCSCVTTLRDDTEPEELVGQALLVGASDVLLSRGVPPMVRLAGDLQPLPGAAVLEADDIADRSTPFWGRSSGAV
jgi:Tfp pilus assembly pilus retraction ATPase PilT